MITKALMCAVVAALALAGCATPSPPPPALMGITSTYPFSSDPKRTCPFSTCPLYVQVVQRNVGGVLKLVVEVEVIQYKMAKGQRDPIISWNLVTPGYEFKRGNDGADPIIFKAPNASTASSQLHVVAILPTNVKMLDKNTDSNEYGYKVRVYKTGTNDFLESDPSIVNDF